MSRQERSLFFNYGENFPILTKKLLDHKAAGKPETKPKPAKSRRLQTPEAIARNATKAESSKRRRGRPRVRRDLPMGFALETLDTDQATTSGKRKRRLQDDSDEERYDPLAADGGRSVEYPGSASLRRRIRTSTGTPTNQVGPPKKTWGHRRGARPGSGRPGKQSQPVPKPTGTSGSEGDKRTTSSAVPEAEPEPAPASATTPALTSAAASASAKVASTPESRRVDRGLWMEIADSDDINKVSTYEIDELLGRW